MTKCQKTTEKILPDKKPSNKYGVPKTAVTIAWILCHPMKMQAIVGTMNPAHLKETFDAAKVDEERALYNAKDVDIIGTQPLCYCKGLKMIDCSMEDCDLAFEYSGVQAETTGDVLSIKNPKSGRIVCDSVGEIIREDAVIEYTGEVVDAGQGCEKNSL